MRFLIAAAAIRPALVAPGTGASALLHGLRMKEGLSHVYEYCDAIARFGDQPQPLDVNSLKKVKLQAEWEAEVEDLRSRAEDWWAQAPLLNMIYPPAGRVWRHWLRQGGLVQEMVAPVRRADMAGSHPNLRQLIKKLADDGYAMWVRRTDNSLRPQGGTDTIIGPALNKIHVHIDEARQLAMEFLSLQASRPGAVRGYLEQKTQALRVALPGLGGRALADVDAFERRPWDRRRIISAAAAVFRSAVEDVAAIFDPAKPLPGVEPDRRQLLHGELLRVPGLRLGEDWEPPMDDPARVLESVLRLLGAPQPVNWQEAFEHQCHARDHAATERIIMLLKARGAAADQLDQLRDERERQLKDCGAAFESHAAQTRKALNEAVSFGLLTEADYVRLQADIEGASAASAEALYFPEVHGRLDRVEGELQAKRAAQAETVRSRVALAGINAGSPVYARIAAALEKGDVPTANEYIDLASKGQPLPEANDEPGAFDRFFPEGARRLEEGLLTVKPESLRRGIEQGRNVAGVDFSQINRATLDQLTFMFDCWFNAKHRRRVEAHEINAVLALLGYVVTGTTEIKQSGLYYQWAEVTTEPVQDVNRCPVAYYGSDAKGHYRVLCVWNQPSEKDLLDEIGKWMLGAPILVFYFGRLTDQRRRDLARLSRDQQRRRTAVVIDDVLLLHLAGERGSRMHAMFQCATPFTYVEPYNVTAGVDVPTEMFYGRGREVASVIDPRGSCFIYGGRQLGKTALLREVERRFHDRLAGRVALWLDLKDLCIGTDRPVEDLWAILAGKFKDLGVVPAAVPAHVGPDKLLEHVEHWLGQGAQRRVLLLMDEADRFVESDALGSPGADGRRQAEFAISDRLTGLMNRTGRRFKIILAGLHNVQRTTKLANHPLTKYGEPICIGPLLENGEWRQARALIEEPLRLLGYQFESPDLVLRILSQTNYYPSLIQLYCAYLLRQLTDFKAGYERDKVPPYKITSRHVDEAYRNQDLQKAIRDRLIWTLQLDQRYEVIAYVIAHGSLRDRESGTIRGFRVSWIRDEAVYWWTAGFRRDPSEEAFAALLDEMVGLGILRQTSKDSYALRSPNVIALMGSEEEIARALERPREEPLEFEPEEFRPPYRGAVPGGGDGQGQQVDLSRRHPLTAKQVSELRARGNGVAIVCGCPLAGLADVEPFLRLGAGEEFFLDVLRDSRSLQQFVAGLEDLNRRQGSGTTLAVVPESCPWGPQWVVEAGKKLDRLKSVESFARLVFVASPEKLWTLLSGGASVSTGSAPAENPLADPSAALAWTEGVSFVGLQPWHDPALRQWLEDCGFVIADKADRARITAVTGNWPGILHDLYEQSHDQPHKWGEKLADLAAEFRKPSVAAGLLAGLGLGDAQAVPRRVLQDAAALQHASAEELADVADGLSPGEIALSLRWAELFSLVYPTSGASPDGEASAGRDLKWQVNPFVADLLSRAESGRTADAVKIGAACAGKPADVPTEAAK